MKVSFSRTTNPGFTLPVVLIISMALLTVGMSLLQNSSSIYDSVNDQYYNRLSQEAAEAGIAYANFCLNNNGYVQTWGPEAGKPNLTQSRNCSGTTISSAPTYLMENSSLRTSFTVGDLQTRDDGAIIFDVSGTVEKTIGTGAVQRTYSSSRSEVVKWKTFLPSVSASGSYKTCAIVSYELYCWGQNDGAPEVYLWGNLGDGTTTDSLKPRKVVQEQGVLAGKVVNDVVSAQYHSCALAEGKVYCWGSNNFGQLGQGTISGYSSKPVEVKGLLLGKTVTAIGASGNTACAITGGKIYCWGGNSDGVVGNNSQTNAPSPVAVSTVNLGSNYVATDLSSAGSRAYNMCAIVSGQAWCWGNNEAGQVGAGYVSNEVLVPTKVKDTGALAGKTVTSISQDGTYSGQNGNSLAHTCAVASGKLYCWGENNNGQLGIGPGNKTDTNEPTAVYSVSESLLYNKTVQDVRAGANHTCALVELRAYCWGANPYGQLGTGNNISSQIPVAVKASSPGDSLYNKDVTGIGGGANRGCALTGYVSYCWGYNPDGQLGDGTTQNRNVPTESIYLRPKAPTYIF